MRPSLALSCRALVFSLLATSLFSPPARGQSCQAMGSRPYICTVDLVIRAQGERPRRITPQDNLKLAAGERLEVELVGVDQYGRDFPADRARWVFDAGRDCQGMVEIDQQDRETFRLEAGSRRGRCEATLWVPGNLNLEWRVRLEVVGVAREGYTRIQAEEIARRLYWAVLGREADSAGLGGAIAEVQRGELRGLVESMFRSQEFATQRSGLSATALLNSFYQGLLRRDPDSAGVRTYLDDVERRRYTTVVVTIIQSEEFEESLLRFRPRE